MHNQRHLSVCMYTYICVCAYIHIYVYVYVYVYICISEHQTMIKHQFQF